MTAQSILFIADEVNKKGPVGLFLQDFFVVDCRMLDFINQTIYNSRILVEVYHDNIGYDKSVV